MIALGALAGPFVGLLLLGADRKLGTFGFFPIAVFGFIPGAIFGGLIYRRASSSLPIDPNARSRRYKYAAFALIALPALAISVAGVQGQELLVGSVSLIGLAFAIGILVSGDRRVLRSGEP